MQSQSIQYEIDFDQTISYNFKEDNNFDSNQQMNENESTTNNFESWKFTATTGFRPSSECRAPIKLKMTGDSRINQKTLEPLRKRLF